jgi:hypothetical protein
VVTFDLLNTVAALRRAHLPIHQHGRYDGSISPAERRTYETRVIANIHPRRVT